MANPFSDPTGITRACRPPFLDFREPRSKRRQFGIEPFDLFAVESFIVNRVKPVGGRSPALADRLQFGMPINFGIVERVRSIRAIHEPEDEHPTMKEVLDKEGAEAVIRVLGINASNSHISPFIEFVPGQDDTQLNVQIREGMTQAKALRMLKEIAFLIEHHWDDLLDPGANGTFMVQRVSQLMAQHAAAIKAAEAAANKRKVDKKSPSVKRRTRMLGGKGAKLIRRAA